MARSLSNLEIRVDLDNLTKAVEKHIAEDVKAIGALSDEVKSLSSDRWLLRGGLAVLLVLTGAAPFIVRALVVEVLITHQLLVKK